MFSNFTLIYFIGPVAFSQCISMFATLSVRLWFFSGVVFYRDIFSGRGWSRGGSGFSHCLLIEGYLLGNYKIVRFGCGARREWFAWSVWN